jgi:hypothetical protein
MKQEANMGGTIEVTNPKDLITAIIRKTKGKQKEFLKALEESSLGFDEIRKLYLDNSNDIVREVIGILFGQEFVELFVRKR